MFKCDMYVVETLKFDIYVAEMMKYAYRIAKMFYIRDEILKYILGNVNRIRS